jgi:hypothetical protein
MAGYQDICCLEQKVLFGEIVIASICWGAESQSAGHYSQQICDWNWGQGLGQQSALPTAWSMRGAKV